MPNSTRGSQWRKWDLHIHTPYTHLANRYNCDIKEVAKKIATENLAVVGVTNYFIVEEKELGELRAELPEVLFIPNFEFRINEKNKDGEFINLHILFNPEINLTRVYESLARVPLSNLPTGGGTKYCTIDNLRALGADGITVSCSELLDQLKKDFKVLDDFLVVGVNRGYGGFLPGGKERDQQLAQKLDECSHLIFSRKDDIDFFLNKTAGRKALGLPPKPVFESSDAHTIGDLGKSFVWVKADLSFEGLKQVLYEPQFRILIADSEPRQPTRRIESIKFNFPNGSVIKRFGSSDTQELCIKHLKDPIQFSPYFTSIIGGRGTGKSTIINVLAEKLGYKTDFFNKTNNGIFVDGKELVFSDSAATIEVNGTDEIEFISQGKVEKLAEGDELTKLVFTERIKELDNGFQEIDQQMADSVKMLDDSIRLAFDLQRLSDELRLKEKDRTTYQKIVDSVNDVNYKAITEKINTTNSKISLILSSKKQYSELLSSIKDLIKETIQSKDINPYEQRTSEILASLKSLEEISESEGMISIKEKQFIEAEQLLIKLSKDQAELTDELKLFFKERGTSEDSIKDSENASKNLSRCIQDIEILKQKIDTIRDKLKENASKNDIIKNLYDKTQKLVEERLAGINAKLKNQNENVLEINFAFEFNNELYREKLFEEFIKIFQDFHLPNTANEDVKNFLFKINPDGKLLDLTYEDFIKQIDRVVQDEQIKRTNKYVQMLTNIFSVKINFGIYKLIVRKHLYNLQRYIRIRGYYGKRELAAASFGQRCTAVIVTLLMTGVKPLVIDEPEAHLDNKLIADYLVTLIKEKKFDRQIIYATHNSNFVINGDSELIHILEIPDNSVYTNIISTTIEDLQNRSKLLKLEGGKDAFLTREHKYGLNR
ncbi:MAG TPA: AAA family ATPase [Ohtaekwangia sp.]|nr:AAA family ATPase [Ohtaekwangia sp.]